MKKVENKIDKYGKNKKMHLHFSQFLHSKTDKRYFLAELIFLLPTKNQHLRIVMSLMYGTSQFQRHLFHYSHQKNVILGK